MEHLERLIPLAILAAIAAIVVFLIRRGRRELAPVRVREETKQPVAGSPLPDGRGSEVAAVVESPIANSVETPAATSPRTPVAQPTTPIQTVLDLLKDKDAVAVGILLSEILGPPVSRRR